MLDIIINYYTELMCTVLVGGAVAVFKYLHKTLKGGTRLMIAIGHDKLYRFAEFYISTNQITLAELTNLEHIYTAYHAFGGNGTGTELYERCKELPIVEKRTKYNPYYTEQDKK